MASSSLGPVDRQVAQTQTSWGEQLCTALLLAGGGIGLGGLLSRMWSGGRESGEIKGLEIKNTTAAGLQTFSGPESTMLFDKMGISCKEPADLKCASGIALGAVGSAVTGNPAALALGSALCFPEVSAQTASLKGYFFPIQPDQFPIQPDQIDLGEFDLCVWGKEGMAIDGYLNTESERSYSRVQLFTLNGTSINLMQGISNNITSQFTVGSASNAQYESGCYQGAYQIFISGTFSDPTPEPLIYQFAIQNGSLLIPGYPVALYQPSPGEQPFPDPWRPTALLGNQSVAACFNQSGSFLIQSLPGGGFFYDAEASTDLIGVQTAPGPTHQDILAFDDNTFRVFTNQSAEGQMELEYRFEPNFTLTFLGSRLVYDQVIPELTTPTTPISKSAANFSTFISRGSDQMTPTLYTYDIVNHQIIANRSLGQQSAPISRPKVAQCGPQYPHLHFYAKEQTANGSVAIDFGYVDAGNSSNPVGAEQTYAGYLGNLTSPPQPKPGCFDDATGIVGFSDESKNSSYFQVSQPPLPSPLPTPVPSASTSMPVSPVPTLNPSTPTPTFTIVSGDFTITISLPSELTSSFVPVTGEMISVGPNVTKVILVDSGGYSIVFTANMTPLLAGQPLNSSLITQLSIAKVNSSEGDPVFLGCNDQYQCSLSTAKSELQQESNLGDLVDPNNNLPIILGAIFGTVALSVVGAVLCWRFRGQKNFLHVFRKEETTQKRAEAQKECSTRIPRSKPPMQKRIAPKPKPNQSMLVTINPDH